MGKETTDLFFNSDNIFICGLFLLHDFASIRFREPGVSENEDKDGGNRQRNPKKKKKTFLKLAGARCEVNPTTELLIVLIRLYGLSIQ